MTPFHETIREIAENACGTVNTDNGIATVYDFERAILSAFDEFAKREPSELMLVDAIDESDGHVDADCCARIFRAMLVQAVKEMKE